MLQFISSLVFKKELTMNIKMSNTVRLRVSTAEQQGGQKNMEGAIAVHFETLNKVGGVACFAVFDGDGGNTASFYARVSDAISINV